MNNNSTPEINEKLMRYLDGDMSEPERLAFEDELARNKELQVELENLQVAEEAARLYGIRQQVHEVHNSMMKDLRPQLAPVKKIFSVRQTIRYAVSIAAGLVLFLLGVEVYQFYKLTPGLLYGEKYAPFELSTARDSFTYTTTIETAYRIKDYGRVVQQYEKAPIPEQRQMMMAGIAYLERNDNPKAVETFRLITVKNKSSDLPILNDEAEFYLALAYMRNKDYDQAIELMEKIRNNPGHLYHEKFTTSYIRRVKRLKWR